MLVSFALRFSAKTFVLAAALLWFSRTAPAGTLEGSFSPIATGSNVNLTVAGKLDWVHWGLGGDYKVNRKAIVTPRISNFTLLSRNTGNPSGFSSPYWFEDASSWCSWEDGSPV